MYDLPRECIHEKDGDSERRFDDLSGSHKTSHHPLTVMMPSAQVVSEKPVSPIVLLRTTLTRTIIANLLRVFCFLLGFFRKCGFDFQE